MDRELIRQSLHILGVVFIVPLMLLRLEHLFLFFGLIILALILFMEHVRRLNKRAQLLKQAVLEFEDLEDKERREILNSIDKIMDAQEEIIENYIKPAIRPEEWLGWASFTFLLGIFLTLILFGREIAIITIIPLAIGDGLATMIGVRFGKHKIPPFKLKSFEGSAALFLSTFIFVYILLQVYPIFYPTLLAAAITAAVATGIEAIPELNDNVFIPILTGFALTLLSSLGFLI